MSNHNQRMTLDKLGVINDDGSRNHPCPADAKGKFSRARIGSRWLLIFFWVVLPWVQIGGHPAVFVDIPHRSFFLFGEAFNAQDFVFFFFFLTGLGFFLIVVSALFGRLWCGWACPQTVFLEGVFRPIERFIDGPRNKALRLRDAKWTPEKIIRRIVKHLFWLLSAWIITHIFLAYFISLEHLYPMIMSSPAEHWTAFLWMASITGVLYFNFWWFREQMCIVICPYGRMQSALQDNDTWIIGYDFNRGEPRGKKAKKKLKAKASELKVDNEPALLKITSAAETGKSELDEKGDCIDCNRCVTVCPTGIDIRNGLQLECIGCAACIDVCDEVMTKLGREKGLIRYDTKRGLDGESRVFMRPRLFGYLGAGVIGLAVALFWLGSRHSFEANVLRVQSAPYVEKNAMVTNRFMLHIVNKGNKKRAFDVFFNPSEQLVGTAFNVQLPVSKVTLGPLKSTQLPVVVSEPTLLYRQGQVLRLVVHTKGKDRVVFAPFLGPDKRKGE